MIRTVSVVLLLAFWIGAAQADDRTQSLIERLKTELATAADPAAAHARIGLLYIRQENADSAEAAFQRAIALNPNLAIAQQGLGRVFFELKNDPQKALPYFEAAVEADSTDARTYDLLVQTHLKLGHTGRDARNRAGRAIARFPNLAAPYLLLARAHQEEGSAPDAALYYYKKYLAQNPEDQQTAYDFALVLYEAKKYRELEELTSRMHDPRALPLLAQALIHRRDHEGARAAFQHYIATLPEEERALYEDISLIGTQGEVRAYALAAGSDDNTQRDRFLERFWLQKDPFKTSGGALRRAEHYRRVWHARTFFGKKWPWDKRGEIYIRYGAPDFRSTSRDLNAKIPLDIQRIQEQMAFQLYGESSLDATFVGPVFPVRTMRDGGVGGSTFSNEDLGFSKYKPVTVGSNWSSVPWEVWIYKTVGDGVEFTFTDEFLGGNYDFAPIPSLSENDLAKYDDGDRSYMQILQRLNEYAPAMVSQRLAATEPEQYSLEALDPLDFFFDALTFRGPNGQTELQVNFALPIDNVALPTDPDTTVVVERRTALIYPRAIDYQKTKHALAIPIQDTQRNRGLQALSRVIHTAPPGEYELAVEAARLNTNRVQTYRLPNLQLPNYRRDQMQISDVELSSRITDATEAPDTAFVRGAYYIQPQPSATFAPGTPMYVFFEIYNLKRNEFGQTHYNIAYEVQQRDTQSFARIPLLAKLGNKKAESVGLSFEQVGSEPDEATYLELPLTNLKPGRYTMRLTVKDQNADQSQGKNITFYVIGRKQRK